MQPRNTVRRARPLLGTFVEISVSNNVESVHKIVEEAFENISLVNSLMSVHDASSDLSRLNREAHLHPMSVHPWTFEVLSFSQRVSEISSGIFDCTVGELLVEWGLLPNLKNAHVVEHSYSRYSFRDVTLLSNDTVIFSKPLTVDLGGIAKGFAVDKAVEHLVTSGITHGVVNAGGDIRAFGDREEPIHVRLPQDPHRLKPILMLSNRAIATSAPYFSKTLYKGAEISPLVDGITRLPYLFDESISVTAPTAMVADALTKVFINPMADLSLLKEFGATLFKTSQDGTVLTPYLTVAQ